MLQDDIKVIITSADGTQRRSLPRLVVGKLTWTIERYGGYADGSIQTTYNYTWWKLANIVRKAFYKGDRVEIFYKGVRQYRGFITGFKRSLDDPRKLELECYGAVLWLRKVACNKAYAFPAGIVDVAKVFAAFAQDYLLKVIGPQGVQVASYVDARPLGITTLSLDARNSISGDVLDSLVKLTANLCTYGGDVDGYGTNRLYIRPFESATPPTYAIAVPAGNVRAAQGDEIVADAVTVLIVQGGAPQYPQLLHNGDFSLPITSQTGAGNLVSNGDFEEISGGVAVNWTGSGPNSNWTGPIILPPVRAVAFTGNNMWAINTAGSSMSQTVTHAFTAGHLYQIGVRSARSNASVAVQGELSIQWKDAGGTNIGGAVTTTYHPPDQSWSLFTLQASAPVGAAKAVLTISLNTIAAGTGGMLLDDVEFYDVSIVYQDGWRVIVAPDATLNALDWVHPEAYAGTNGVLIDATIAVADTDFHDVELIPASGSISYGFPNTPVSKFQVQGGNGYLFECWAKYPTVGATSPHFPDLLLAIDWYDSNGGWLGPPVRQSFAYSGAIDYTQWRYFYAAVNSCPAAATYGFARLILRSTGAIVASALSVRDFNAPHMLDLTTGAISPYQPEGALVLRVDCDDPYLHGTYLPGVNGTVSPLPKYVSTAGVGNPAVAPTLAASTPATPTPFGSGTYLVAYSYVDGTGETLPSPTSTVVLEAGQAIDVTALAAPPGGVVAVRYYIGPPAGPNWPRNSAGTLFYSAQNTAGQAIELSALPLCASYFFARAQWGSLTAQSNNSSIVDVAGGLSVSNQIFIAQSGVNYRPSVTLLNDTRPFWPGQTVAFVGEDGPSISPVPQPIVRISGSFDKLLALTLECQREQPDETIVTQQLILHNLRKYGPGGTGFGGGGFSSPSNGTVVGPGGSGGSRFQRDDFAVGGGGPYTLTQTPTGALLIMLFDGVLQATTSVVVTGTSAALSGVDTSQFNTVTFIYTY